MIQLLFIILIVSGPVYYIIISYLQGLFFGRTLLPQDALMFLLPLLCYLSLKRYSMGSVLRAFPLPFWAWTGAVLFSILVGLINSGADTIIRESRGSLSIVLIAVASAFYVCRGIGGQKKLWTAICIATAISCIAVFLDAAGFMGQWSSTRVLISDLGIWRRTQLPTFIGSQAMILGISSIGYYKSRLTRLSPILLMVLGIIALAFSASRTEVIVVIIAVISSLVVDKRRKNVNYIKKTILVLLILVIGLISIEYLAIVFNGSGIWATTIDRFKVLPLEDMSAINRKIEMQELLADIPSHLLTGRGYGNYLPAFMGSRGDSDEPVWGHNEYLYILLIMGIPGFVAFAYLLIWLLRRSYFIYSRAERGTIQAVWSKATLLLYISYAFGALFVPRFARGSGWIGPQIMMGVIFVLANQQSREKRAIHILAARIGHSTSQV